jgi:hypothetical protein
MLWCLRWTEGAGDARALSESQADFPMRKTAKKRNIFSRLPVFSIKPARLFQTPYRAILSSA